MRTITDKKKIDKLIREKNIASCFDTENLSFTIREYQKGEILTAPGLPAKNFLFLVEGVIQIYGIHDDGSKLPVNLATKPTLLGDVEYCGNGGSAFFAEAWTAVTCLALSMDENREKLYSDVKFLHTLLDSLVEKITLHSNDMEMQTVEKRVLFYMENVFKNHELKGVEATAIQLRCSRRQLQRTLKSLCDEGKITHTGKGRYKWF